MSQATISKVASFVTLVALVAGCSPTTPQATASVEAGPTTIAPALSIDACSVPVPAVDPVPGFPARPPQLLGGGVIESGDFTFDMWLFCDPSLSPSAEGAAYSEIASLGIHLVWRYAGSEVNAGTEYSFGLGDLVIARGGDSGPLTHGSMASYSGGVHSPNGALGRAVQSGNLVTVTTQVTSGSVQESATLSFAFQPGISGLKLAAINLEPSQ